MTLGINMVRYNAHCDQVNIWYQAVVKEPHNLHLWKVATAGIALVDEADSIMGLFLHYTAVLNKLRNEAVEGAREEMPRLLRERYMEIQDCLSVLKKCEKDALANDDRMANWRRYAFQKSLFFVENLKGPWVPLQRREHPD